MQRNHQTNTTRPKHHHHRRRPRNTLQQLPPTPRRNARKRNRNQTTQPTRPKIKPLGKRTQLHIPSPKSTRQNTNPLHQQRQQTFPTSQTGNTWQQNTLPQRNVHRGQGATGPNPPPTPQQPQQDTTTSIPTTIGEKTLQIYTVDS